MTKNTDDQEKRAYRVKEFCAVFGIGATKTFEEIAAGRLRAFKIGRARLISREAADEWFRRYEQGGDAQPSGKRRR